MALKYWNICCLVTMLFAPFVSLAQNDEELDEKALVRFNDLTWYDKGFDFYIGAGGFQGNSFNANYYNGSNLNENNLNYLFDNQYWREELMQDITECYPNISINDQILPFQDPAMNSSYNWETNYKLRTMIALGARYKIRNGWALSLSYSFSRLVANSRCLLDCPTILGNQDRIPEMLMVGREDRSMIDLSLSYLISQASDVLKPFIELGVQFNYAKVKDFDAILLDKDGHAFSEEHSLLDRYNSSNGYVPGMSPTSTVIFGGPGFGFSGAAGLKIVVSRNVSLDPTFYCYMGRLGIYQMMNSPVAGFDDGNRFTFNWGIQLRVVMNDFFVSQRH